MPVALTDEPAGTIATRTAGAVRLRAVMSWRHPEDLPESMTLPELPGGIRHDLRETGDPATLSRTISGRITSHSQRELALALEACLRDITAFAAFTDAVLETHASREAYPSCTPSRDLETLAHDLWRAGFCVRFGPSWRPLYSSGIAVGCRGAEAEISEFFRDHPEWRRV